MARRPIFLLAETGFIIRNLLLGTFADIVTGFYPLIVAVPNPTDAHLQSLVADKPIQLTEFPREASVKATRVKRLTSLHYYFYYLKMAQKKTESLQIQTQLFESQQSNKGRLFSGGLIMAGKLLASFRSMNLVEDYYLSQAAKSNLTQQWKAIFLQTQPSVLVSTMLTHSLISRPSSDLAPTIAAYQLGIPVGTLVQSWDNLSSKTSVLPKWVNQYWTWSETMSEELLTLNQRIASQQVHVVGSPQFDMHRRTDILEPREQYMQKFGFDPQYPFIVIGTGTKTWLPNEPHTVVALVDALRNTPGTQVCHILIRLHPKDTLARWQPYRDHLYEQGVVIHETSPEIHMDLGGFVPPKEFYHDQVNCLTHAAVVVNTASTLTIDAAILNRPVVSIGYDVDPDPRFPEGRAFAYNCSTHYSRLVKTGGVWVVRSLDECLTAIQSYLSNPMLHRQERTEIVKIVTAEVDGAAGYRLAAEVLHLAGETAI